MSEKPRLYHGSCVAVDSFVPFDGKSFGVLKPYKGTLATPSKDMALLYTLKQKEQAIEKQAPLAVRKTTNSFGIDPADYMITNHLIGGVPIAIIRDHNKFLDEFKGGYLYELPNESFSHFNGTEWLSEAPAIQPKNRTNITLEKAMEAGCQIFFLKDGLDFHKVAENREFFDAGSKQLALLKRWVEDGTLTHENRTKDIKPMDLYTDAVSANDVSATTASQNYWTTLTHHPQNITQR